MVLQRRPTGPQQAQRKRRERGAEDHEPHEENPMIGYRGCYRYVKDPELFDLELEILAQVRDSSPNVNIMIPFVRTKWELESCLERIDQHRLGADRAQVGCPGGGDSRADQLQPEHLVGLLESRPRPRDSTGEDRRAGVFRGCKHLIDPCVR